MNKKWKIQTLREVVVLQRGFDLPEYKRKPGNVPVVTSAGISGFHNQAKVKAPGVVIGRTGTLGRVHYITEDFWPHNTSLYVKDFKDNDPRFIAYLLQTINYQAHNDKSGVPGVNRNHLYVTQVRLPPIEEQRSIAQILCSLDDKIELNRRMNQTLESMAQALFKSWFVDFDPVVAKSEGRQPSGMNAETAALFPSSFQETGNEDFDVIPAGWHTGSLSDIANYENGLALQKYRPEGNAYLPVIKIRELRQGFSDSKSEKASPNIKPSCIIDDGDVIFSWSGSLMIDVWCGGKGALNQHLFKVTSDQYPKWFYYFWTKYHLADFQDIADGKATTMGHTQRHHLEAAKVVIPSKPILEKAHRVLQPIMDQIVRNRVQSWTLAYIRDTLLPKLLSGEVRTKV